MARPQSHHKGEDSSGLVTYDKDRDMLRIKPLALDIVWGQDPRYWKLSPREGYAELLQVSWFEVTGQIDLTKHLKKGAKYMLSFTVELRPDNFGWGDYPVYFMVRVGQDRRLWKKAYLKSDGTGKFDVPPDQDLAFRVPERCGRDEKLTFGMYEIWKGRWKGGLVIHEVVIAPVPHA